MRGGWEMWGGGVGGCGIVVWVFAIGLARVRAGGMGYDVFECGALNGGCFPAVGFREASGCVRRDWTTARYAVAEERKP